MIKTLFSFAVFICLSACGQTNTQSSVTAKAIKAECDDPDAPINCSFVDMPATKSHIMRIPGTGSGTPMIISGTMYTADGSLLTGATIYAYHTDEKGIYSKNGKETGAQKWHGQHHGWAVTNEMGQYEIHSIRPAKYPNSNGPAHIHSAVKIPGTNDAYWISDFVFKDDPAVTEKYTSRNPGGTGVVDMKLINGKWMGVRDITLPN